MDRGQVVIGGASGLLGRELSNFLRARGWQVLRLVRRQIRSPDEIAWDPNAGKLDPSSLDGVTAVINLSGESVAGRWTEDKKRRIMNSRVQATRTLAAAIAEASRPPAVWISASAIGYYGDGGNAPLDEAAPAGDGFLCDVCVAWERAADPVRKLTRVVHPRIGLVLAPDGGALEQMLPPFKLGVGGTIGDGSQYMSWIGMPDLLRGIEHCLLNESVVGAVNFTAPAPVTNAEFTQALGKALHRPTLFRVPRLALRLRFGEFAESLVVGQRALPKALLDSGFVFEQADLEAALRQALEG